MDKQDKSAKVFVAGHGGLVGSAVVRALRSRGYNNLLCVKRNELDLTDQGKVQQFFAKERPVIVIDAAARVGGILANSVFGAEFIYENLQIQNNLIWTAHQSGVETFIFLGSSCIYPRLAPQPMLETCLLESKLEDSNRPYALAKISGLELISCIRKQFKKNFFSVMPTNLYGPNDNFDHDSSHVLPALLQRFHEAKSRGQSEVIIWGTGTPKREFLHADDCAEGVLTSLEKIKQDFFDTTSLAAHGWSHVNLGTGQEVTIKELATLIAKVVGFSGRLTFDHSKPDGTPRKVMDSSLMRSLGWRPKIDLVDGVRTTYEAYRTTHKSAS